MSSSEVVEQPTFEVDAFTDETGATWVPVATERELKRRRKLQVRAEGRDIALFWVDERAYAFQNVCIHKKRHLSRGTILGSRVICPGHQWAFELETGYERSQDACQPTYAVQLRDEHVFVVPEPRVLVEDTTWEPGLNR